MLQADHWHPTASPRAVARAIAIVLFTVALTSPVQVLARSPTEGTLADPGAASPLPVPVAESGEAGSGGPTPVPAGRKYARWLRGLGLDQATIAHLAATLSTAEVVSPYTIAVHHAFPDGTEADLTYRLVRSTGMALTDRPSYSSDPEGDTFQIRYAIDASTIPAELLPQGSDGLPTVTPTAAVAPARAYLSARVAVGSARGFLQAGQPSTAEIIVSNGLDEALDQATDRFIEDKALDSSELKYAAKGVKTVLAIQEVAGDIGMYGDAVGDLEGLRDCAKDPTNPLTEQAYQEDPSEQQRVVDELDEAISDTEAEAAVTVIMTLTGPASSFVEGAPGLGFIVGTAKDWSKQTLKSVLDDRVKDAEKRVVPCRLNFTVSGSAPTVTFSGRICDIERPFKVRVSGDFNGTIDFSPHSQTFGRWSFEGKEISAGFGITGLGDYSVRLSDDRSSGSLDFKFRTTIHRPIGGNQSGGGKVSLRLAKAPPCLPGGG